jgi:iron complex outermembrane receptor protein
VKFNDGSDSTTAMKRTLWLLIICCRIFALDKAQNDFHFDDDQVYRNNRIAGIPEHFYQADLLYTTKQGWYAGPNVLWSIARYPVDQAGTLFADPYALIGFTLGLHKEKGLSIFLDAHNLGNARYAAGVDPIPDARIVSAEDLRVFYPGDRINFSAGVEWRF